jgi:hypothetical protein
MVPLICPNCNAHLPPQEGTDGWCETCGKKLPAGIPDVLPMWSDAFDRILLFISLLFVVMLLVIGIARHGLAGVWSWFYATLTFVVWLSALVCSCERCCQLYPRWKFAYSVTAVIGVLASAILAVSVVLVRLDWAGRY